MSMEYKEVVKKAIQNEFRCYKCDFKDECIFCNGDENAEEFGCSADTYERGFKNGFSAPAKEVLELIKNDPLLTEACLSTLSRHFALNCSKVGASVMSIKESYTINQKNYNTTFVVCTAEDQGDNFTEMAQRYSQEIYEYYLSGDLPESIKNRLIYLFRVAMVLGYNMKDDYDKDEDYEEED